MKYPKEDYFAVIFISEKSNDLTGYEEMDELTINLAQQQPGFIGYESVTNNQNKGIFISYWESMDAIENWRKNSIHLAAKNQAKKWYKSYISQICKVQKNHEFENS